MATNVLSQNMTKHCFHEESRLPKNPIFVLISNTQTPGTMTQRQGHGNDAPDSKCEQRVHNGQEVLPKATVDWRMTKASSQPERGCHDRLEEGGPEREALASTAPATRTMKKQPHPMSYPMKPVLPSVPETTGNPPAKLTEAMSRTPRPVRPLGARDLRTFSDGEKF